MISPLVRCTLLICTLFLGHSVAFGQSAKPKNVQTSTEKGVAFTNYKASADAGNPIGMVNTGLCYEFGWGVAFSKAEALFWYRKALEALKDADDLSLDDLEKWRNKATAGIAGVKMGE